MSKCSICLEEGIIVNRCVECYKKVLEISEKNGKVEARRETLKEVTEIIISIELSAVSEEDRWKVLKRDLKKKEKELKP